MKNKRLLLIFSILCAITFGGHAARRKKIIARNELPTIAQTPKVPQLPATPPTETAPTKAPQTSPEPVTSPPVPTEEVPPTLPPTSPPEPEQQPELPAAEELEPLEAPQQEPEEPEKKEPEESEKPVEQKDIYLNFHDADLASFVHYIGQLKNINITFAPNINMPKISLTIRKPLTVEGAWKVFLTVIEMAEFSIVEVGPVHKIIPKAGKLTEPLPTYINVAADTLPDSDLTIRFVTFLNNIPIDQVEPLLKSMLSQPNQIIKHPNANGFVITDKSYNIKAAMEVVQDLDRPDLKQSVTVMKLKRANAKDVKDLFDSFMQKKEGQHPLAKLLGRKQDESVEYFPPTTKIVAEHRTNSLILLGDQKSIKRIEDFIVQHIDTELKGVKSPIHVYELKHTDVEEIKRILDEMVTDKQGDSDAAKYGGVRGGLKYFKPMKFSADKANNRLIVSSTDDEDWKLLKKTIEGLDKPQPQVALETLVVSIDFETTKELGSQIRNKKYGQLGSNINVQAGHITKVIRDDGAQSILGNLYNLITFGQGSTVLTFGKATNVWNVIRMLKKEINTTVISQPFVTTTNMRQATILVGEKRRILSSEAIGDDTATIGEKSYEDSDAGLTLKVTPQINLEGVINLDIDLDLKEFLTTGDRPDKTTRNLATSVSMANGQILVLGGFVKTKVAENTYKTPFLGNIPVFGWLFKNKNRTVTKEYIFIFMSPTIIKPRSEPGANLYTKMKLYQAKNDIDDAIEVDKIKDPIHNWFFNPDGETYSHKIIDFANARYQPTSVDIKEDPYYRTTPEREEKQQEQPSLKELWRPGATADTAGRTEQEKPQEVGPEEISPVKEELPQPPPEPKPIPEVVQPTDETSQTEKESLTGDAWREEKRKRLKQLLAQPQPDIAPDKDENSTPLKQFLGSSEVERGEGE